jgi:hypothetical protein
VQHSVPNRGAPMESNVGDRQDPSAVLVSPKGPKFEVVGFEVAEIAMTH